MNRHRSRNLAWLFALALLASPALPACGDALAEDEQTLRNAGLSTDGPSLLAIVRRHTLTAEIRKKIDGLIGRLGADSFAEREKATKELFALGRVALPQLREGSKHEDPEIARRAKSLIEHIERERTYHLPIAAIRLLAVRKPTGVVETLLAYVPRAEDESQTEEMRQALTGLALRDGKPDPALLRALSNGQTRTRIMAIQALAKGGGVEGRSAVRKFLKDDDPIIRLRVALALALAKEKDSIPVLIDLLAVLPNEQVGEIESVLYELAGDTAPKTPVGMEPAEKKKCRDAWIAWWKANADRADLTRLIDHPQYGFTLICDNINNRVYEIDRHGKERWAINNVMNVIDAVVVSRNRVLVAEYGDCRISERDFTGKILWEKRVPGNPMNIQRLPNGNTFVACWKGPILEVDRAGKEIYTIANMSGNTLAARCAPSGTIFCTTFTRQCLTLDTTGKQLKSFESGQVQGNNGGGIDLFPNGHILITRTTQNKVMEFDPKGKVRLEVAAPGVCTASALPNGHILVAARSTHRVYELDRAGKVVWEHKNAGHPFRARRR